MRLARRRFDIDDRADSRKRPEPFRHEPVIRAQTDGKRKIPAHERKAFGEIVGDALQQEIGKVRAAGRLGDAVAAHSHKFAVKNLRCAGHRLSFS